MSENVSTLSFYLSPVSHRLSHSLKRPRFAASNSARRIGIILAEHRARSDVVTVAVSSVGRHAAAGDGDGADYVCWLGREGYLLWEE